MRLRIKVLRAQAYKDGKVEGMQFSTSAPITNAATNNNAKAFGLSSEISSAEAKEANDKAKETQAKPVQPNLTQEEKKE